MRGLSLIELLVVLAIVSALVLTAVFNAPSTRSGVQSDAEQFAAILSMAEDAAVVSGRPVRIIFTEAGFRIEEYVSPEWRAKRLGAMSANVALTRGTNFSVDLKDPFTDNEKEQRRSFLRSAATQDDEQKSLLIDPRWIDC